LILAFLTQSTSQLWTIIAFKINQYYIAANLCINRFEAIPVCKGYCYLENQLNKDQKKQQKLPDLKIKEINLFCQYNSIELTALATILNNNISYPRLGISFIPTAYLLSVFRPPCRIV